MFSKSIAATLERHLAFFGRLPPGGTTFISDTSDFDLAVSLTEAVTEFTIFDDLRAAFDCIEMKGCGPEWGWWAEYYPPTPYGVRCLAARVERTRRAQARSCRADRKRWKLRRFLHALRRAL